MPLQGNSSMSALSCYRQSRIVRKAISGHWPTLSLPIETLLSTKSELDASGRKFHATAIHPETVLYDACGSQSSIGRNLEITWPAEEILSARHETLCR